jgi:hypothetical protein
MSSSSVKIAFIDVVFLSICSGPVAGQSSETPAASQGQTEQQSSPNNQPKESVVAPSPDPGATVAGSPGNRQPGHKDESEYWKVFGHKLKITDTLVAAFTFFVFIATVALWLATRSLVRGAENTAERQLRAFVAIHGGEVTHAIVDDAPGFRVHIEMKNSGVTPAYDFTTWIKRPEILEPDALPFGPPTPTSERTGGSIVAPGSGVHQNWYSPLLPEQAAEIRSGVKAIFIWGGANYRDAFGKQRHFVYRIAISGGEDGPGMWALKPHKQGYDAD